MKFEEVLYTQKAYHHKPTFLPTRATAKSAGQCGISVYGCEMQTQPR